MALLYSENFIILTSTVFDWSTRVTDRQGDRQTDERQRSALSIANKKAVLSQGIRAMPL